SRADGTLTHRLRPIPIGTSSECARSAWRGPTLLDVNEVVPWSSRARDATASVGRRLGDVFQSLWDWFTDLGTGAWVLGRQPRRRVRRSLPVRRFLQLTTTAPGEEHPQRDSN